MAVDDTGKKIVLFPSYTSINYNKYLKIISFFKVNGENWVCTHVCSSNIDKSDLKYCYD